MGRNPFVEGVAARLLDREGVRVIWETQVEAAQAHNKGHHSVAATLVEVADAAESEWLRRCRITRAEAKPPNTEIAPPPRQKTCSCDFGWAAGDIWRRVTDPECPVHGDAGWPF